MQARETACKVITALRKILRRIETALLLLALLFTASTAWDMYTFTDAGRSSDGFPGFEALRKRNTDIAGWIRMDGTHIDHPVLRGKDNFEYLSKSPDGDFYQGGSIFLDAGNSRDFSDQYIIIHGHHMARGAMFSDVSEYLNEEFFEEHSNGELLTPGGTYQLTAAAAGIVDAYDGEMYYTGDGAGRPLHLMEGCLRHRNTEFNEDDKLVVLSTCAGDMSNDRVVLFCRARLTGDNHGTASERK
jgi:sortase B